MSKDEMSFWDHLDELRGHLIRIVVALTVLTIVGLIIIQIGRASCRERV